MMESHETQGGIDMKRNVALPALMLTGALCLTLVAAGCGPRQEPASDPAEEQQEQVVEDEPAEKDDQQAEATEPEEPSTSQADPADPPLATGTYELDGQTAEFYPMSCGSVWTFDNDGEPMTVTTDAPHPVQYAAKGMVSADVTAATPVVVAFNADAPGATVTRWSEAELADAVAAAGSASAVDPASVTGEPVDVEVAGGKVEFSVESGYRYGIDATFASGTATYVFTSPAA